MDGEKNMKFCTGCGEYKEYTSEFFHNVGGGKLRSRCKVCHNKWRREYKRQKGLTMSKEEIAERNKKKREMFIQECDTKGQPCKMCGERKPVGDFYKSHQYRTSAKCKECSREYAKKYHKENYPNRKQYHRDYYQKNKEYQQKWQRKYKRENLDKIKAYRDKPHQRVRRAQSKRLTKILKAKGIWKKNSILKYIGCTKEELVEHIEKQFKPGMNWENYGLYGWHIDHIRPCASFDLTKEEEIHKCFHYSNLQPLWAEENLKKSATWSDEGRSGRIS